MDTPVALHSSGPPNPAVFSTTVKGSQAWPLGRDPQLTWSMVNQPLFIEELLGGHGALQLETLFLV